MKPAKNPLHPFATCHACRPDISCQKKAGLAGHLHLLATRLGEPVLAVQRNLTKFLDLLHLHPSPLSKASRILSQPRDPG